MEFLEDFIIDDFIPAYVKTYEEGKLKEKVEMALDELLSCNVCPRRCGVKRIEDKKTGICRTGRYALVSSAFPHFGEEDVLRGWYGSGTIFFSLCNLRCVFCQNWDISWRPNGREMTGKEIAEIMIRLRDMGCHNINFVTPEHVVPQVLEAIYYAVQKGLRIPIVYNTSAYDSENSIFLLDGVVDIYMPDFKVWRRETAKRLLRAEDYPDVAKRVIKLMHNQVGVLKVDRNFLSKRGVLLRHLVMPNYLEETREILKWISEELSKDTYLNLMDQYYPANYTKMYPERYPDLSRHLSREEYLTALQYAKEFGIWRIDRRFRRISVWNFY